MGTTPGRANTGRPSTVMTTSPFLSLAPLTGGWVTMSLLVCFVAAPLTPEVARTTGCGAP